jgi:hypothetical protein
LAAEPVTQGLGGGDDKRLELALCDGRCVHRGAACRHEHRQSCPFASGAGLGQVLAGNGFAASADRVERVRLGTVAPSRPVRAIQLDHQLVEAVEVPGQAGAITAGPLDRPCPKSRVPIGHSHELGVAVRVGVDGELIENRTGGRIDHPGGGVCLWVSTPMTRSTSSASMVVRSLLART